MSGAVLKLYLNLLAAKLLELCFQGRAINYSAVPIIQLHRSQLFSLIDSIPQTELVTVSSYSDVEQAGKDYSGDKTLEVQLHPNSEVLDPASDTVLPERLDLIRRATAGHKSYVIAGGLVFFKGFEDGMRRARELCETVHRVLGL